LQIKIPQPCNENWQDMNADGNGIGFCNKCQHHVVDFSQMNDAQLIDYLKENPFTHCAKFSNFQLNRDINIQKYKIKTSLFNSKIKVISSVLFLVYQVFLIGCKTKNKNREIKLHLIDGDYKDIKNESVLIQIYDTTNKTSYRDTLITTNETGELNFIIPKDNLQYIGINFRDRNTLQDISTISNQNVKINSDTLDNLGFKGLLSRKFIETIYSIHFFKDSENLTTESKSDIDKLFKALEKNKNKSLDATIYFTDSSRSKLMVINRKKILKEMAIANNLDKNRFHIKTLKINNHDDSRCSSVGKSDTILNRVIITLQKDSKH
jgi:hypothetical protein